MPKHPLIAGNWKMHGLRDGLPEALAMDTAARNSRASVAIFPPSTLLFALSEALNARPEPSPVRLGGQDCHKDTQGAFTGDLSAEMLKDAGADMVILGHSERRHGHKEACESVAAKTLAALRAGLEPIICIGETLDQRQEGLTHAVLSKQLRDSLPLALEGQTFHVAYEPVWAIGTGHVPTDDQVIDAMLLIQKHLAQRFHNQVVPHTLYGGSVKPDNARHLLSLDGVDGLLVGGASLKAEDFNRIIAAAD
ncbi:triose-phosphate isomerase [Asticcacaulis excentricus]|uniref:Triosephosphate isomerase n=1 Tax=Asticcacaulis excentricus TaxID=78587 RepID=A0A3G9GAC5_9CAUL|nr:triose-phosphate isomerase [Asticcacaulis excentricus]BBF82174.1 triosephosphate isomerase [Asticcacaulis excentricus]